jgi:hypothetical protein
MHPAVTLLQTADADHYVDLLRVTRAANERFAQRAGADYVCHLGIKRGYYPWHATFNRIPLLKEMLDAGYDGWVLYMDADAYIVDLDFDLRAYLADKSGYALIAGPATPDPEPWCVNAGTFLIDLRHPDARRLVELWHAHFMSTTDAHLRASPDWHDVQCDQERLQHILISQPALTRNLLIEDPAFFNGANASFLRQALRSGASSLQERIERVKAEVAPVLAAQPGEREPEGGPPRPSAPRLTGAAPDADTARLLVRALYREVLGRAVDASGLEAYGGLLETHDLAEGVAKALRSLLVSGEYRSRRVEP